MTHADRYRKDDPDRRFLQSRRWREKLRPQQLRREPLCRHCRALGLVVEAQEIDHITRPFGDKRLQRDAANLQALCKLCHQRKSNWERRNDGQPLLLGAGDDGWPVIAPGGRVSSEMAIAAQPAANRTDAKPLEKRFRLKLTP